MWMVLFLTLIVVVAACAGRWRTGLLASFAGAIAIQFLPTSNGALDSGVFLIAAALMTLMIDRPVRTAARLGLQLDQLRPSEEKLRLLVDSTNDYALCLLDADGRVATWNSGAERLFGYARTDMIGRHLCCLYSDAAVAAGEPIRELDLAAASGRCERRDWQLRRNGSRLRGHTIFTAIHDPSGELRGYSVITRELPPLAPSAPQTGLPDEHRRDIELALANQD